MHIAEMSGKYATTFITSNIEKQFGINVTEFKKAVDELLRDREN